MWKEVYNDDEEKNMIEITHIGKEEDDILTWKLRLWQPQE
jgi:hypothetical protein